MTILCIDGYNFLHRARSGFNKGNYCVAYNFFRNLRALVAEFKPNRVYFVTEGKPVQRLEALPTYKANRVVDPSNVKKVKELESFHRQKNLILDLLRGCFPISVMNHPNHEGDDVIYNLIKTSSTAIDWIVASNDSDFTQLLDQFSHVRVYNPMQKTFVEKPPYDYVAWKSLRGDGSDNIPGVPGFGDVKAAALVQDAEAFQNFCRADTPEAAQWAHNFDLIHFFEFSDHELSQVESSAPVRNWEVLRSAFQKWGFHSLLKEPAWSKFIATFDPLWGE